MLKVRQNLIYVVVGVNASLAFLTTILEKDEFWLLSPSDCTLYYKRGASWAVYWLHIVFVISLAFIPCNIEPTALTCNKGALIGPDILCLKAVKCCILIEVGELYTLKGLFMWDKCLFVSNTSGIFKPLKCTTKSCFVDLFNLR